MNRLHRLFRPVAPAALRPDAPGSAATLPLPNDRASLQGLEVSDSSWDEWVQVQRDVQARHGGLSPLPARGRSLQ